MKRVSDARLDALISGKYDWPTLPAQDVKSMAIELRILRNAANTIIATGEILKSQKSS